MAEQGRQKVACTDTKVKMNSIDHELSQIVGLKELKLQLSKFIKGLLLDERRRALGLDLGPRKLPHFAFLGDPGTGKSMVARMLGKLLHMVGVLSKDKVTEVQLEDLVPNLWLKRAAGGILLVNDCIERFHGSPFGLSWKASFDYSKAIENIEKAIIPCMDSGRVLVIMAGRPGEMEYVMSKYVELRNRFSNIFNFGHCCSGEQLATILEWKVCNNIPFHGFKLHTSCTIDALAKLIMRTRGTGENGHKVDKMLIKAKENLDSRIDVESTDVDAWVTFTIDDFSAAALS